MFPVEQFHRLESELKKLGGLIIVNKPPVYSSGLMEGDRFFTCLYNGQYYCVEVEEKTSVVVKVYLNLSPWTKQRALDVIRICKNDFIADEDIEQILSVIQSTPKQTHPLPGAHIQQIYGGSGFHPLSGYYLQLSKMFLDSLGDSEKNILNELEYIENISTTVEDKIMLLHGFDGQEFRYNLLKMNIIV